MTLEIILAVLVTSVFASIAWMIEYAERNRIVEWYERSYIENGIRYVREVKRGITIPVQYAIYRLKDGELTYERDC
jgi:hypothetical protein